MSDTRTIAIPRETVNDDFVTIVTWYVNSGDQIKTGDILLDYETSKAVITIEAEQEGYIEILHHEGENIAVGKEVGRLHPTPPTVSISSPNNNKPKKTLSTTQQISQKAQRLIEQEGLDLAVFKDLLFVREADVIRYIEEQQVTMTEQFEASAPTSISGCTASSKRGGLHNARDAARSRGHSIFWLACNYFFRNYLLGLLVRIAPRGLILLLHRLRGVKIGKGCFIDPTAVIETAYPENITLGNDVFITAHVVVMTHIKAPHYLRETGIVPPVLKKVVIEDHSFIGVNAVIMPGVTVGKASVVASGAVVVNNVPSYTMVIGNPAKIIKHFSQPK